MPRAYIDIDLVVEARKAPPILGDQLRIEGRQPVARHRDRHLAAVGQHRLLAIAVAAVGLALRGLAVQMLVDLGVQRPLRQRLLQLVDQAVLGQEPSADHGRPAAGPATRPG